MHPSDAITLLNLEFNSSCNLRCKWCALDHEKERQIMSTETLENVMKDLLGNPLMNLKRIDLHNGGETLLHPDLPAMLTVIRRYKPQLTTNTVVGLLTNAMLLTPKTSKQIVRSRAIDQIRFSLDGGSPESFENIRCGAKWNIVARNISSFLEVNAQAGAPVSTEAICIIPNNNSDTPHISNEFATVINKLDKVSFRHPHNWDGSVDLGVEDTSYRQIADSNIGQPCFLLQRNIVILPNGSVTVCCNDLNGRGIIGSIKHNGLGELIRSTKRLAMIQAFKDNKKHNIKLCRNCTGFYAPTNKS